MGDDEEYNPFAEPFRKRRRETWDGSASGSRIAPPPPMPDGMQLRKPLNKDADVSKLIGTVRPLSSTKGKTEICAHFLMNDCLWGDKCRFSHDLAEVRRGLPATEEMNFSNLEAGRVSRSVPVASGQIRSFMSDRCHKTLCEASGVAEIIWDVRKSCATMTGMPFQVDSAEQLLKRATTHCKWGSSEAKILGLLNMQPKSGAKITLAPMEPSLKQVSFTFTVVNATMSIGSSSANNVTVSGPLISRSHAMVELVPEKGALYVLDLSTNGTFLNGVRLPRKGEGKVILSHGDELLFPEVGRSVPEEFGYMVNLEWL